MHQLLRFFGEMQIALFGKLQHAALGECIEAVLTDKTLLAIVLPKEKINHDTCKGDKGEHHHPRHGFGGLPVVHEHC